MNQPNIKNKIIDRSKVLGTWNTLNSLNVFDVIASTALDFIIFDLEHGPFDMSKIAQASACARSKNVSLLVRIPKIEPWMILQALDQGANGLVCPHIKNLEESKAFTSQAKYPPLGTRGFSPYTAANSYNNNEVDSYISKSNKDIFTIAIIECVQGLKNISSICEDPNLDAVYFGSYDLSQALGVPGDISNPIVVDSIMNAAKIAQRKKKYIGGFIAFNEEQLLWQKNSIFDIVIYGVDSNILYRTYSEAARYFGKKV
jgi:2-keto-3-deoxy-L-rhamnonate aldolase RhmA